MKKTRAHLFGRRGVSHILAGLKWSKFKFAPFPANLSVSFGPVIRFSLVLGSPSTAGRIFTDSGKAARSEFKRG